MSQPPKEQDNAAGASRADDRSETARGSRFQWAGSRPDPRPVYRVVEMMRNADGRLRKQGNIWHVDLDVPRKFGRALAANTSSHRIVIEDNQGRVLEELPVTGPGERRASWANWEDIPLPVLPPTRQPPRHVPVLRQPPVQFEADLEDDEELEASSADERDLDVTLL